MDIITMTEGQNKENGVTKSPYRTGKRTTVGLNEVRDAIEDIVNQTPP
jgi:hypothetical protein